MCFTPDYETILAIVAVPSDKKMFATLNIDNQNNEYEWNVFHDNHGGEIGRIGHHTNMCCVHNDIHISGGGKNHKYLKYNQYNDRLETVYNFTKNNHNIYLINHGMLYLNALKKVIIFGGSSGNKYSNEIFLYDINTSNMKKLSNFHLPNCVAKFGYILYRNRYIIIFGGETEIGCLNDIYVLDIAFINNNIYMHSVWQRNQIKCPIKSAFYAIITSNENIHLFERDSINGHKHWFLHVEKLGLKQLNEEEKANINESHLDFSEKEFIRFLEESLPKGKHYQMYLDKFVENEMNDARFIHALTDTELKDDIGMKQFHRKYLLQKIEKYKFSHQKFQKKFEEINMFDKYYGHFEKNGIVSFWSFYHCIKHKEDIKRIVSNINENDLEILWLSLCPPTPSQHEKLQSEGTQPTNYI